MSNGQITLLILGLSALVSYIAFAAIYHNEAKGYGRINFRTFRYLYKAAPEKWDVYWKYGYAYYYTSDTSRELVHMKTYLDRVLLFLFFWIIELKKDKGYETEKTLNLIEYWRKDLEDAGREHTDT